MKKLLVFTITTVFIAGSMSACVPARRGIGVGHYYGHYPAYYSYWDDGDYFGSRRYRDRYYYHDGRRVRYYPPRVEGAGRHTQQPRPAVKQSGGNVQRPVTQRESREQARPRIQQSKQPSSQPRIQQSRPGGSSPSIRRSGEADDSTRQKVTIQET